MGNHSVCNFLFRVTLSFERYTRLTLTLIMQRYDQAAKKVCKNIHAFH